MKRNWTIYPWHGRVPEKIVVICKYDENSNTYSFEGTVDEFLEKYKGNVLVLVDIGVLGVSHKNHFRQC